MGKEQKKTKTLKSVSGLEYVEILHVPMIEIPDIGFAVHSTVLGEVEKLIARELILRHYRIRGQEVKFLRNLLGFSQRQLAEKLRMSHVSILKWEKAKIQPLDLVNEVALKALLSGFLGLKVPASLEALTGIRDIPKKLTLDYHLYHSAAAKKIAV